MINGDFSPFARVSSTCSISRSSAFVSSPRRGLPSPPAGVQRVDPGHADQVRGLGRLRRDPSVFPCRGDQGIPQPFRSSGVNTISNRTDRRGLIPVARQPYRDFGDGVEFVVSRLPGDRLGLGYHHGVLVPSGVVVLTGESNFRHIEYRSRQRRDVSGSVRVVEGLESLRLTATVQPTQATDTTTMAPLSSATVNSIRSSDRHGVRRKNSRTSPKECRTQFKSCLLSVCRCAYPYVAMPRQIYPASRPPCRWPSWR